MAYTSFGLLALTAAIANEVEEILFLCRVSLYRIKTDCLVPCLLLLFFSVSCDRFDRTRAETRTRVQVKKSGKMIIKSGSQR